MVADYVKNCDSLVLCSTQSCTYFQPCSYFCNVAPLTLHCWFAQQSRIFLISLERPPCMSTFFTKFDKQRISLSVHNITWFGDIDLRNRNQVVSHLIGLCSPCHKHNKEYTPHWVLSARNAAAILGRSSSSLLSIRINKMPNRRTIANRARGITFHK